MSLTINCQSNCIQAKQLIEFPSPEKPSPTQSNDQNQTPKTSVGSEHSYMKEFKNEALISPVLGSQIPFDDKAKNHQFPKLSLKVVPYSSGQRHHSIKTKINSKLEQIN